MMREIGSRSHLFRQKLANLSHEVDVPRGSKTDAARQKGSGHILAEYLPTCP